MPKAPQSKALNSSGKPLDFNRLPTPRMGQLGALQKQVIAPQSTRFATPKTAGAITQGRSNAQDISQLPPSTKLGY